ncbi:ABC-type transporter Mla subunit MlaD [Spinactinospora alkalitolerans]|uniref:ABC-type transporter Mla subunit MlaD n=1 Tax=Spinactinospora alkalitolerans TaxID=687207 RepID=A0A852U0E1_9ACTN|nr:hypothetical protein [Spinactinospora alkalitolerans]NYE49015.1 ABC-type transporter Mla subunit MlaD [Spinactinospora alkalitolerans]
MAGSELERLAAAVRRLGADAERLNADLAERRRRIASVAAALQGQARYAAPVSLRGHPTLREAAQWAGAASDRLDRALKALECFADNADGYAARLAAGGGSAGSVPSGTSGRTSTDGAGGGGEETPKPVGGPRHKGEGPRYTRGDGPKVEPRHKRGKPAGLDRFLAAEERLYEGATAPVGQLAGRASSLAADIVDVLETGMPAAAELLRNLRKMPHFYAYVRIELWNRIRRENDEDTSG